MPDFGISAEISGTATTSGNATQTTFNIPHGLGMLPRYALIQGMSTDAADRFDYTADSTNIIVVYNFPPPAATNNLVFVWRVGV